MPSYALAILSGELTSTDVVRLISTSGLEPDIPLPAVRPGSTLGVSIGAGQPFMRLAKVGGITISVANLIYPDMVRGSVQGFTQGYSSRDLLGAFSVLREVLARSGLMDRLFTYELAASNIEDLRGINLARPEGMAIKSMRDPVYFGIRIFESSWRPGEAGNPLLMPWKEIRVEPLLDNPSKFLTQLVFRAPACGPEDVEALFADLRSITGQSDGE